MDDHDFCRQHLAESRREQRRRRLAIGRLTAHRYTDLTQRARWYQVCERTDGGERILGDYRVCCSKYATSLVISKLLRTRK